MMVQWELGLPLLEESMLTEGLKDMETYIYRSQNTVTQYISTQPIPDL